MGMGEMAKTQVAEVEATKAAIAQEKVQAAAKTAQAQQAGEAKAAEVKAQTTQKTQAAVAAADKDTQEKKAKKDAAKKEASDAVAKTDADTSAAIEEKKARDEIKSAFAPVTAPEPTFDDLVNQHALLSQQADKLVELTMKQQASVNNAKTATTIVAQLARAA